VKSIRELLSLIIVAAILFASTLSVCAIGFEAETIYESVFVIYSGQSIGSGFAVGENCIVTNAHVISNKKQISVVTYEGTEYQASLIGMNEIEDIAVLVVVDDVKFPYITMADLSDMKIGDDIYAIGAPKGMAYTLTKGSISAKERIIGSHSFIQIDAPINEGNSGGPLLNETGAVLGMNTLKMSDSEGLGLAIPIQRVCEYLRSLGLELHTNGNVIGRVQIPEENPQNNDEDNKNYHPKNYREDTLPVITYIALGVALLSVIGNIVLVILLIYQKKKNITMQYDPRERTDFDIDILE